MLHLTLLRSSPEAEMEMTQMVEMEAMTMIDYLPGVMIHIPTNQNLMVSKMM
jgi:hypothetical protein